MTSGKPLIRNLLLGLAALAAAHHATALAQNPTPRYELVDLDEINATTGSWPRAINNAGTVIGTTEELRAVRWDRGRATQLGSMPGHTFSDAVALSETGTIVGRSGDSEFHDEFTAVSFQGGQVVPIVGVGNDSLHFFSARAIDNLGRVAGTGIDPTTFLMRGYWIENGVIHPVGDADWRHPVIYASNDAGQVAGYFTRTDRSTRPFLWQDGAWEELPVHGGPDCFGWAYDMDSNGRVVGQADVTLLDRHAVLWENDEIVVLGSLGGQYSAATGINERGQIVGVSHGQLGGSSMFLWQDGFMVDVAPLVVGSPGTLEDGYGAGINDAGQITGTFTRDGHSRAVVLTPVDLELSSLTPGRAGEVNRIEVRGLEPGTSVDLVYGRFSGLTPIPGSSCSGATILLNRSRQVTTLNAGDDGIASFEAYVPEHFRGRSVRIQACDADRCRVSNVAAIVLE